MKTWLVLGVLLAGIFQAVPKQADEPKPNQDDSKHIAGQPPKPGTAGTETAAAPGGSPAKKENGANSEAQQPGWCERLLKPMIDNWPILAVTIWAIIVALGTLNHMRESSERELRAYVVAEIGSIVNVANPLVPTGTPTPETDARIVYPNGPVCFIKIKNTGQTPAFEVTHWSSICLREFPLNTPLPEEIAGILKPSMILGPGIAIKKRLEFGPSLTEEQIAGLRNGKFAIYVHGEILYVDAFKQKRFTRYRLMHHITGGVIGVSTDLTFADGGNEAD